MKYIKSYNKIFESKDDIENICKKYGIENYTINEDGSIDVGYVNLYVSELTKLPIKFRNVTKWFSCDNNKLTSLEGCPKYVGGDFNCQRNKITTFEHLPLSIGGEFYCIDNPIWEIWKLFKDYSKIEFLNDCDALREPDNNSDKPIIILDRLNYFLKEIGEKAVTEVKGYKCI